MSSPEHTLPQIDPQRPLPSVPPPPPRPSGAYPDLDLARQRSVRLIISIPVITLLIVLGSSAVLYAYLMNFAESPSLPAGVRENIEEVALTVLLISTFSSLVSGVLGYLIARQIVQPIKDMTKTMEALAEGDFSTKLEPIRLGEFGQLGVTFNRMVEQLNRLFQERDRQLRESFSGAHLIIDSAGIVVQADVATRRILGLDADELLGKILLGPEGNIPVLVRNPKLRDTLADILEESKAGRSANRTIAVRGDDGLTAARYLVSSLYLKGDGNTGTRHLVELRDITGISGFYEQMQRADRLAAIGTLATGIAHEIRNPLASIRGMIQLLAESSLGNDEGAPDAIQAEYYQRVTKEVDRLEKLVAGIMNFAQTAHAPLDNVDVNSILRDAVLSGQMQAGEGAEQVEIVWDLEPQLPRAVLQAERLRQALLNLAINAFQHCIQFDLGPVRIQTLHLSVNTQRPIIICIANPGEPIDSHMRERIFEPFFTTKPQGTGLGLPIAYQTISTNGGVLELECQEGEIQFWIRLPRDQRERRESDSFRRPTGRTPFPTPVPTPVPDAQAL